MNGTLGISMSTVGGYNRTMFKKGAAITFIFIISTAIQLLSQIIITRIYGASLTLDTFLAAVAIPTILVTVIYGTVNDAFLPLYGEEKTKNPEHSDQYFFSHVISLTICFFIAAVALMIFSDQLSQWFYNSRGVEFVRAVANQMRFMMLSIPLALIATMLGSYFYSHKQFIRFPVAQAVGSLINILIIFALAETIGITALIIGFVVNIFFQILFVIPTKLHAIDFKFANIAPFFIAWIPVVIGAIALRSDALLIRSFGAHLPAQSVHIEHIVV